MPQDSIAIFPKNGHNENEKTSRKAILWLKYLSETQKIYIKHSKNGGEKYFNNYIVPARIQTQYMNMMVVSSTDIWTVTNLIHSPRFYKPA
jgi:hypothetical protein